MSRIARILTVLLMAVLLVIVGQGQAMPVAAQQPPPAATLDSALIARIEGQIAQWMQEEHIPGVAIGIVKDRQVAYMKGFGVAEAGTDRAFTPQTVILLACASKPATATAVMRLVTKGKIDLDAPVTTYLPYFQVRDASTTSGDLYKEITVRHLLTNRSGLPEEVDENEPDDAADDDGVLERHVRRLASAYLIGRPGRQFIYSNPGFHVLGDVIAKASG